MMNIAASAIRLACYAVAAVLTISILWQQIAMAYAVIEIRGWLAYLAALLSLGIALAVIAGAIFSIRWAFDKTKQE